MNIGVLNRLQVLSGSIEELVIYARSTFRLSSIREHFETAFYLSSQNPQEVYILSLWNTLQDLPKVQQLVDLNIVRPLENRAKMLEQHIYKLRWEYRKLPYTPKASNLRLMRFPADFSKEQFEQILVTLRQRRPEVPHMIGVWAGSSIENEFMTVHRIDWDSEQAQQEFANSALVQEALVFARLLGIKVEYASFNLQAIVHSDNPTILF